MSYEEIKIWLAEKENKNKIALGISFVVVFLVGFGAGSFAKTVKTVPAKSQYNYTTSQAKTPTPKADMVAESKNQAVSSIASSTKSGCLIKGNISSSGRKIYHVPTGALYKVVKPEQCFDTEAEALAAGFVKSGR